MACAEAKESEKVEHTLPRLRIDVTESKQASKQASREDRQPKPTRNDLDLVDARAPVWTEVDSIQDLEGCEEPKRDPKHPCPDGLGMEVTGSVPSA